MNQGTAQSELLLHAAGKFPCWTVGKRRQAGAGEQLSAPPGPLRRGLAKQSAEEIHVLDHGEGGIEVLAQPLGHVGNAWTDRVAVARIGHVSAQDVDAARLDLTRSRDQGKQTGFADSIRPDKADHAPGGDVQSDGIHGDCVAVTQGNAGELCHGNGRRHHGASLTCRCAGQAAVGLRRTVATPGRPVFTRAP